MVVKKLTIVVRLGILFCLAPGADVIADDAGDTFKQLYGDEINKVSRTSSRKDDIDLAKQLIQSADELKDGEPILVHFYLRAFELAQRSPDGATIAMNAMQTLAKRVPDRAMDAKARIMAMLEKSLPRARGDSRKEIGEQLLAIYEEQAEALLESGDANQALVIYRKAIKTARMIKSASEKLFKTRLERATELSRVLKRIGVLKKQLLKSPDDRKAGHELVMALLVKFNKPEAAKEYVFLVDDPLRSNVGLACQKLDALSGEDSYKLGTWYSEVASSERGLIRMALLERGEGYLTRALKLETEGGGAKSVQALKISAALKKVKDELDKLREATGGKGRWIDLTKIFAKMIQKGAVEGAKGGAGYKDGVIVLAGSEWRTLKYPVDSKNVIVSAEIKKVSGLYADLIGRNNKKGELRVGCVVPVLVIDQNGSEITRAWTKLKNGDWFELQMAVLGDNIFVYVNGKRGAKTLSKAVPGPGYVGIRTRHSKTEFRKIRYMVPTPEQIKKLMSN